LLTLSLNKRKRISLPIAFGERQRQRIEGVFEGDWPSIVEMVKRNEWYAHFVLKKTIELPDEPETVIPIDRGEHNLAVAIAISRSDPRKPIRTVLERRGDQAHQRSIRPHQKEAPREAKSERLSTVRGRGAG